ncbi:MAG: hypothetical protein QGI87_06820, partial [Candidatus Bathyarchaeota archaeon]|nr:hypothetical protein [Candidatus Bathyarchaeota archaeon]
HKIPVQLLKITDQTRLTILNRVKKTKILRDFLESTSGVNRHLIWPNNFGPAKLPKKVSLRSPNLYYW